MAGQPKTRAVEGRQPKPGARGYKWPDAEPGNTLAVKHGGWSERLIAETIEELRPAMQRIIDQCAWLQPIDEWAISDYLYDRARLLRIRRWVEEQDDAEGPLHEGADREVNRLMRRCLDHRARLGLDPASRSRLALERALAPDVAAAIAGLDEEVDGGP